MRRLFPIWVLANAVGFGVPAGVCFIVGWILWKKTVSGRMIVNEQCSRALFALCVL